MIKTILPSSYSSAPPPPSPTSVSHCQHYWNQKIISLEFTWNRWIYMNLFAMTVELYDLNVSRAYQFVSLFLPLASEALILELSTLDSKRHPTANTNFQNWISWTKTDAAILRNFLFDILTRGPWATLFT